MRLAWFAALVLLALTPANADPAVRTRTDLILERFENANQWRDHVMVVAHRAGVREMGTTVRAESSLAAIETAIELGAEMVELDIQKTKDGVYVVMHDTWLDRTTTCKGKLVDYAWRDLAACRLVVDGSRLETQETVPSLEQALQFTRGRILVNIDNKLELEDLVGMTGVAERLGMAEQVIVKQNLWNREKIDQAVNLTPGLGKAQFMPILADDAVRDVAFIEAATRAVSADAAEMVAWSRDGRKLGEGGLLFGARARAIAARGDWHLWVNTFPIVNKPGGYLARGRGDELASYGGDPAATFGFWAEEGATIIQTDEPKAAIEWLEKNGYRVSYDLVN